MLTLPVCRSTPVGDTNIPEPIILPTMTVTPLRSVILGLRVISSSSRLLSSMVAAEWHVSPPKLRLFWWRRPALLKQRTGCKWINSWTILNSLLAPFWKPRDFGAFSVHLDNCPRSTSDRLWARLRCVLSRKCEFTTRGLITFGIDLDKGIKC